MSQEKFKIRRWLVPLSVLYGAVTSYRNKRYDTGACDTYKAPVPVISIGNITAGGTGKTPHTEYLIRLLGKRYRLAVLSRGYRRRTKGYLQADAASSATDIGDEPYQMHAKFPETVIAVCERRADGIQRLLRDVNPEVIVLDDAFQHRAVTPSLNILLVNWNRNIMEDRLLPAGLLREDVEGRRRADIIIVTKCPDDIGSAHMEKTAEELRTSPGQMVFFSTMTYGDLIPMVPAIGPRSIASIQRDTFIIIATGIASPAPIAGMLSSYTTHIEQIRFADHHNFTPGDIDEISNVLRRSQSSDAMIVVTEKDAARLSGMEIAEEIRRRIYILPISVNFIGDGKEFDDAVLRHIGQFRHRI